MKIECPSCKFKGDVNNGELMGNSALEFLFYFIIGPFGIIYSDWRAKKPSARDISRLLIWFVKKMRNAPMQVDNPAKRVRPKANKTELII